LATPLTHFADVEDIGGGQKRAQILAYPKYYLDNGFLVLGAEGFVRIMGGYEARRGVHWYRVMDDGTFTYGHLRFSDSFTPLRQVTASSELQESRIPTTPPSRVMLVADNEILHENVLPGVNRRFRYWADGLYWRHELTDAVQAEVLKGSRFFGFEFRRERRGEFNGRLAPGYVSHEGFDADDEAKAHLRIPELRETLGDIYRVGLNPQDVRDWLSGKVTLNDSVTYQEGVDAYSGWEDNYLYYYHGAGNREDWNYGADDVIRVGYYAGDWFRGLIRLDLSGIGAGATCSAAVFSFYDRNPWYRYEDDTKKLYAIAAANGDWVEGTEDGNPQAGSSCWNHKAYDAESPTSWAGSAGCSTAGTDYVDTELASALFEDGYAGWVDMTMNADGRSWLESAFGEASPNGLIFVGTSGEGDGPNTEVYSSEYATPATRPKLTVTYTAGGGVSIPVFVSSQRRWRN